MPLLNLVLLHRLRREISLLLRLQMAVSLPHLEGYHLRFLDNLMAHKYHRLLTMRMLTLNTGELSLIWWKDVIDPIFQGGIWV